MLSFPITEIKCFTVSVPSINLFLLPLKPLTNYNLACVITFEMFLLHAGAVPLSLPINRCPYLSFLYRGFYSEVAEGF